MGAKGTNNMSRYLYDIPSHTVYNTLFVHNDGCMLIEMLTQFLRENYTTNIKSIKKKPI